MARISATTSTESFLDRALRRAGLKRPRLDEEIALADPYRLYAQNQWAAYNPDELIGRKGIQVYEKMRHDEQVKAALTFKKLAAVCNGYEVTSPQGQPEDWEVTRFVEAVLARLPGTLYSKLYQIMSALDFGYSISELVFEEIPDGDFAGFIGYKDIKTRRPRYLGFQQDEFGNVLSIVQYASLYSTTGLHLPLDKFVVYSYNAEFQNAYGQSDLRAAYRSYWTKDHVYKWMGMMLERYGIPPAFILYDPDSYSAAALAKLQTVMNRLQAATSALIPRQGGEDTFDLQFPEVAGQVSNVFIPALEHLDKDIARAILMPGLMALSPDDNSGSLARARVVFDVFMFVINALRNDMEETVVNEQIVKRIVDLNFNVSEYPRWRLIPITDDKRIDLLKEWSTMVSGGIVVPTDEDEKHIRRLFDFPERDETDEDAGEEPPEDGMPLDPDAPMPVMRAARQLFRKANDVEVRVDFAAIQGYLDEAGRRFLNALRASVEQSRDALLDKLVRQSPQVVFRGTERLRGAPAFDRAMKAHTLAIFERGRRSARKELPRRYGFGPNYVPREAVAFLKAKALQLASTVNDRLLNEVKLALAKSIELGESGAQAADRLRDVFEPYLGDATIISDGEQLAPYRLEVIVRTETTDAFNKGRLIEARDPAIADAMRGFEFSAVLDERTTTVCEHLDGSLILMGDPNLDKLTPPLHYNCRSILVPVTVHDEISENSILTAADAGKAIDLAGKGFV